MSVTSFNATPLQGGYCAFGHKIYAVCNMPRFNFTNFLQTLFLGLMLGLAFMAATPSTAHAQAGAASVAPREDCAESDFMRRAREGGAARDLGRTSSVIEATMRSWDAKAAVASQCIDRLADLLLQIASTVEGIVNGFNNPIVAVVTILVAEILVQLMNQLMDQIVNAVCNVADQIYNFIEGSARNLLCIPQMRGINPFNFDLNLRAAQCGGWSISLLDGNIIGSPVEGLNIDPSIMQDARTVDQTLRGSPNPSQPAPPRGAPLIVNPPAPANPGASTLDCHLTPEGCPPSNIYGRP